MSERCFACNRPIKGIPKVVGVFGESTQVHIGPDCYKRVSSCRDCRLSTTFRWAYASRV